MAYIIPNATDTTSSNKYAVLEQAEPDSIDFEILGNDRSGVVSGCGVDVTPSGGNTAVAVEPGVVALNGSIYTVAGNPFLGVSANPTSGTARFDLVIARLTNNEMALAVITGAQSSTNPTYPVSKSRRTSVIGLPPSEYFDPDTDVVLAALYRQTSLGTILRGHIVDKRRSIQTPIAYRGTAAPTAAQGSLGDLYLRTSDISNGESGLYIKRSSSQWTQMASVPIDPGVPIGSVITWVAANNPNTAVWVECNGAEVSRIGAYSALFDVLGTLYGGGNGSTSFTLPDFRGLFLAGLPSGGATLGALYGNNNNEVTLNSTQVPGHTHPINHSHPNTTTAANGTHGHGSEGGSHVHEMRHGHSVSVSNSGEHTHFGNFLENALNTGPNHYLRPFIDQAGNTLPGNGVLPATTPAGNHVHSVTVSDYTGYTAPSTSGTASVAAGSHTHTVNIPQTTGVVSDPNRTTTSDPVNIQPRTIYVRYFIRYA